MMGEQAPAPITLALERQGKTLLLVECEGKLIGILAVADSIRPEVAGAIKRLRALGISKIELLTGDNRRTAAALASALGITYQAELLPEDKIRIVKEEQERGHTVVMIGDGVNDAPALKAAHIGIAMGARGSDVAREAAALVPADDDFPAIVDAVRLGRRIYSNLAKAVRYVFAVHIPIAGTAGSG